MKYFFSNDCYWDSEKMIIIRANVSVDLPSSHKRIIATLLENNGHFVAHEALYFAMTGEDNPYGDWKASLSNKFTRNKASEKGILIRIPEIVPFFDKSKSRIGGGYKISVPEENIVGDTTDITNMWDEYRDIWHSNKYWESQQKKARISERDWLTKKVKLYLQGEACSWPIIFASSYAPVKRDVVDELKNAISNEVGAIVLTGAGGEGKTTILMQLCAELYRGGKTVFYHAPTHKYDIPDNVTDGIFLVDNPANTVEFKSFLTKAVKEGLTVVLAARSNEWSTLKETLFDDIRRSVKEIEIARISASEAKAFAQYLKSNIYWIKRSVTELETLFFKDSYGFLYASMLMAIYNADSLEKIAEEIIERISKFANGDSVLKILAAIVFAEQAGTRIGTRTYRALCRHFSVDERDTKYYLRKEVVLNGTVYQTRHKSISRLFYKYLFEEGDWWNYLDEENQEDTILAVLEVYLGEIAKSAKDYKPTDPRVIETASLFVQSLSLIDYEETQQFIIQRLFESCQQHGHAIMDRVYHHTDNNIARNELAIKCFDYKLPVWEIYNHWIRYILDKSKSYETVINYIKTLCLEMDAPVNIWKLWIEMQERHTDEFDDASLNTTREIYKLGLKVLANNAHWWISWASFEKKHENLGDVTIAYSARWILKEGCNHVQGNPHLWIKWADIEAECENLGDPKTKYTSRWIAKEGCSKIKNTQLWIKRAELEDRVGNTGDISTVDSARWMLYIGCEKFPQSTHMWIKWAEIEIRMGNIGDYETINSAAWIFKEACTNNGRVTDAAIWMKWSDFATNYNSTMHCSNIDEFTPSKILKYACIDHKVPSSQMWMKWADIEEDRGNIGGYDVLYSAAWILMEACMQNVDEDDQIWADWACFIERNKEQSTLLNDYPPDVILKNKCLKGTANVSPWVAWAVVEEDKGNIGDYTTEYSAAWIYKEGCINNNPTKDANCLIKWARFAHKHPILDTDGELINAEYVLDYAQKTCDAFSNQLWIALDNLKKEIGYQ